mmetsp:Transcript_20718/g.35594  ORF Transcript_20718/g.35594 Transcript_20718/m.35594 type:complete len:129 (-) Transcript_20718:2041-2427(-)
MTNAPHLFLVHPARLQMDKCGISAAANHKRWNWNEDGTRNRSGGMGGQGTTSGRRPRGRLHAWSIIAVPWELTSSDQNMRPCEAAPRATTSHHYKERHDHRAAARDHQLECAKAHHCASPPVLIAMRT